MPVEIRELIIKATVTSNQPEPESPTTGEQQNNETLIADTVEQVMEIIRMKNER